MSRAIREAPSLLEATAAAIASLDKAARPRELLGIIRAARREGVDTKRVHTACHALYLHGRIAHHPGGSDYRTLYGPLGMEPPSRAERVEASKRKIRAVPVPHTQAIWIEDQVYDLSISEGEYLSGRLAEGIGSLYQVAPLPLAPGEAHEVLDVPLAPEVTLALRQVSHRTRWETQASVIRGFISRLMVEPEVGRT